MASYLRLRSSTYHFRLVLPEQLRPLFNRREVACSLGTGNRAVAKAMALSLAGDILTLVRVAAKMSIEEQYAVSQLFEPAENAINRLTRTIRYLNSEKEDLLLAEIEYKGQALLAKENADRALTALDVVISRGGMVRASAHHARPLCGVTLKQAIEKWLDKNEQETAVKQAGKGKSRKGAGSLGQKEFALDLLLRSIGDVDLLQITSEQLLDYGAKLGRMPTRSNPEFKGCLSIDDFIKRSSELVASGVKVVTLKHSSINTAHVMPLNSFIKWVNRTYHDKLGREKLIELKSKEIVAAEKGGDEGARAMSKEELSKLFSHPSFVKIAKTNSEHYWIVLLLLFTGMRVNEVMLINPEYDVKFLEKKCFKILSEFEGDGVHYIWLNERSEKAENVHNSIKSHDSDFEKHRIIPIHPTLIRLGFLEYCKQKKADGFKTLFPQLAGKTVPERGASKLVTKILKDTGVYNNNSSPDSDDPTRDRGVVTGAHSFRDTLISSAKNRSANMHDIAAVHQIAGHAVKSGSDVSDKHYSKKLSVEELGVFMNKFDFYDFIVFPRSRYALDE